MRYRRFGTSDLEVSEVGFGTWTLASNWWGEVEDKRGMLDAALHAGITFFDTAPVYGDDGLGETLMADFLKAHRDEIVLTTKCGYDLDADARRPAQQRERPHDWRPESIRKQCDDSLRRLGIDKDGTATLRLKAGADPGCDETCRARFHPPVGSEDGRLFRLDPGLTLQWVAEGGACWSSRYERAAENSGLGFRAQSKAR